MPRLADKLTGMRWWDDAKEYVAWLAAVRRSA
jgi:hypothetical protein